MFNALLFKDTLSILVSADEIANGKYSRTEEFVDPEYEFKVIFVNGAKNNGRPHFRLYYSYEEYKKLFPDRADRYAIVANMRKYQESQWHRKWKDIVSHFCSLEKCIKNPSTGKWKFADAFYDSKKTCIEFQNSYISFDFEERNSFYNDLGIKTIWLYNLPSSNVRQYDERYLEILEDNSKGFFRISEMPENLTNYFVYIQIKNGTIYRVKKLFRHNIKGDLKSTIRYFEPVEEYSKEGFVEAIKYEKLLSESHSSSEEDSIAKTLSELWNKSYIWMIVKNITNNNEIMINRDHFGNMYRDFSSGCIKYKYVDGKYKNNYKEYHLNLKEEDKRIWKLLRARTK